MYNSPLIARFASWFRVSRPAQLAAFSLVAAIAYRHQQQKKSARSAEKLARKSLESALKSPQKSTKVAVDRVFFNRLRAILPIILPGFKSREFLLLVLHTGFLVSRTLLSIYVAQLDGRIVKSIVQRRLKEFLSLMVKWMLIAVPATYVNSMIVFLENKLAIAFRTRMVNHCYGLYMSNDVYYRIGNLDSRLSNPDQTLTEDVSVFCSDLAHLYSHLSKPCLDVVLMTAQLIMLAKHRHGSQGISSVGMLSSLAFVVIFGTGFILRVATPPFGKLVAEQAKLYGKLRAAHSRIITHAEEIAFYSGQKTEQSVLHRAYQELIKHTNYIYKVKISYTMLEQFLMKYCWGALGMVIIALPAFQSEAKSRVDAAAANSAANATTSSPLPLLVSSESGDSNSVEGVSTRTQDFVTSRGLLISAADAIERMMSSYRLITELAGRTARITELLSIFEDVKNGDYEKQQAMDALEGSKKTSEDNWNLSAGSTGTIIDSNDGTIELRDVPVVTPNGDMLLKKPGLSLKLKPGMHLLITGPNGCGKSSFFRMLGGIWPIRGGFLKKPSNLKLLFVPQKPFMFADNSGKASLRAQFIYPDTLEDMRAKGISDLDLEKIVECVALKGVVEREGGWDAINDWRDVLSGGEKQRVAMARLFYHKPDYAILDECTSAVSIDVEGQMYEAAKAIGITLLTVTHRPTLWKYHTHMLMFDGQGNYTFSELNATTRLTLHEEKAQLEQKLASLPTLQTRLKSLCEMLGEQSIYVK